MERADKEFKTECFTLNIEEVFVSHLPDEEIYQKIKRKLENREKLTEQELMRLIILPLAPKGNVNKQKRVEEVIELAKMLEDEQEQAFVIAGILVCSDKFIDREYAKGIRRYLSMTKVFQILEEEKQEAIIHERRLATMEEKHQTAARMIRKGMTEEIIMEISGLTKEEISKVRENMLVVR